MAKGEFLLNFYRRLHIQSSLGLSASDLVEDTSYSLTIRRRLKPEKASNFMTTMTFTALPMNVSLTETVGPATMTNFLFNPEMQFRNTTGGVTMPYVQDQLVSCNFNIVFFATIAALFGFILGAFIAGCTNNWLRADMELERLKDAVEEYRRSIELIPPRTPRKKPLLAWTSGWRAGDSR